MYYLIGADGKMNGPLSAADVHQWLAEGRANKYTRVRREGDEAWQPLASIPELTPPRHEPAERDAPPPSARLPDATAAEYLRRGVTLDAARCVARGWALVRDNPMVLVGTALLAWTPIIALLFVPRVGWVVGTAVNTPLLGGLYYVYLRRMRGFPATITDVFAGFRFSYVPLLVAGLLTGGLTTLGLLLFIVPGVYLAVAYMFVVPLVMDKRMDVWTAMEVSRRVVHRQWWTAFALVLVATLMTLAGLLAFGAGVLIALPVATAALMCAYEDLFGGD